MKNMLFASLLAAAATASFAQGVKQPFYPENYRPHGDLSAVSQELPRQLPARAAKNDDSVKIAYTGANRDVIRVDSSDTMRSRTSH